jgi:hypothetical protein
MYPVQPPAKIDEVVLDAFCGCDWREQSLVIASNEQEAGAKMGFVFDALVAVLDAYDETKFTIIRGVFPVLKANGQTDDDGHKWLMGRKKCGKENVGLRNYITIYELHWEECFGVPYTYEVEAAGLRIRDFEGQHKHSVGNGCHVNLPRFLEWEPQACTTRVSYQTLSFFTDAGFLGASLCASIDP